MSVPFAERARFFEGQYLGAADLESLVTYFSSLLARHQLGSHSWGICAGIDLVYQTSPLGAQEVYLTPGVATDGYGRLLVVPSPVPLDAGLFAGQPAGEVPVWLRYRESAGQGVRPGFEVCDATDAYSRVIEWVEIDVGEQRTVDRRETGVTLDADYYADAREAPGALLPGAPLAPDGSVPAQRLPVEGEPSRWLIPVGKVIWQGGQIQPPTADSARRSRLARHYSGLVVETIAGSGGLLRLGERLIPRIAGGTVDQAVAAAAPLETDLLECSGSALSPRFKEPIWLDADTRARGALRLYGTRAEWVDQGGTDYLADGILTALRRTNPSPLTVGNPGVDLEVLLGTPQGTAGPTRLTIGAASLGAAPDPCAPAFDYAPGVAIQQDGRVGIGAIDAALGLPLTIRAIEPNGALIGLQDGAGDLAWQINLGPSGNGLNVTGADPTASNLFIAAVTGDIGIGTLTPEARLDIRVSGSGATPVNSQKWLHLGDPAIPDGGQAWFQYGPQLAPLLVLSDLDDPPRIQFQQTGTGTAAAAQHASWIGHARGGSPDLAISGGSLGIGTFNPSRVLHAIGEIHSGGTGGGFSFENRETASFVNTPTNGERWVWYASDGDARLWSGNDKLAVTPTGRLGIGTDSPAAALDVRGAIRLGASGSYFAVGGLTEMRIVAGFVPSGGIASGPGWSSSHNATGSYRIDYNPTDFSATPVVVVTPVDADGDDQLLTVRGSSSTGFSVISKDSTPGSEGDLVDTAFNFIAYGPRP
jgi:hypothetical protein